MLQWRLLLFGGCLLFCLFSSADSSVPQKIIRKVKRGESAKIRDFCSGTYNGRTMAGNDRLEDLRNMYENCTRVRGNVEITHLTNSTIHDGVKKKLRMFEHIEEIKGYLLIYNVDVDLISFPNLKIIWGDSLFEDHLVSKRIALMISGNHNLKEIYMPKLRSVHNGDILIENNTFLCYLKNKVNWNELVDLKSERYKTAMNAFRDCDRYNFHNCHENCTSGYCWGKLLEHCQTLYRTPCPEQCNSCYWNTAEQAHKCCHPACEGGCRGSLDTDCIACKQKKINNSCVEQCPPLQIMNRKGGRLINNPDGTYIDDRYCVKQCATNMLIQNGHCVRNCAEDHYHDVNKDTRMCEPCPKEGCPRKTCEVNQPLTRAVLANLTGCEVINGFLRILGPLMTRPETAYTVEDLNVLRNVRIVSEYVYMVASTDSPTSMNFLENLEVIEGRALDTERFALVVSRNDNLAEIGLKKLRKIKAGNILITENHSLCYAYTINWTTTMIPNTSMAKVMSNRNADICERRNLTCDRECNKKLGCWGKGPEMCLKCANWKLNGTCVEQCPTEGFYRDYDNEECRPCFEQCKKCEGPKKTDCSECKHFSLHENNRLTCVKECDPKKHFQFEGDRERECLPCHESCYDHGCTGPNYSLGQGGCNKCKYGLVDASRSVLYCLFTDRPQHEVCLANNLTHHYVSSTKIEGIELTHCSECDDDCVSCTSAGKELDASGCVCKDYIIKYNDKSICGTGCLPFSFKLKEKEPNEPGVCQTCNDVCDRNSACKGSSATDCDRCAYASMVVNETITCVKKCPQHMSYVGHRGDERICAAEDIDAIAQNRKTIGFAIGLSVVVAVIVAVLIIIYKCRRLGRKLKDERNANLADIPEQIPMGSARPNLAKVNLISKSDLESKHERKLGSGAFGEVFAGYWYPKGTGGKKVPVAIKVVNGMNVKNKAQGETEMLDEAAKMAQLRHIHLLRLIGICLGGDSFELITLLRPLGNLLHFVRKHKDHLMGKDLLLYCYQISSAMKYLEENKLVHRDLAARNVLVKKLDHVEVTDFGLAKFISYGQTEVIIDEGKIPIKWVPPEVWETYTYTSQSDVWSYGITCWEILTFGMSPYQSMDYIQIKKFLYDGKRLDKPKNCSTALHQILLQCWMVHPESRPCFSVLYDRFKEFCKTPQGYVVDNPDELTSFDKDDLDQEKELRELLDDDSCWDDVEDPLVYFDTNGHDTDSLIGQPMGRGTRRLTSTSSTRYQTDPMTRPGMLSKSISIGLEDNYLVPDSKLGEEQARLYTPVVVNESGGMELVEMDYYNDQKPGTSREHEYYNDGLQFKKQDSTLRKIQEETEEIEKESCL